MIERKVETYTTNESGQKIVTYQGQGLGERKLVIQKNGRTVSVPCNVLDCLYYDEALGGQGHYNDAIWQKNNATITRQDDGSLVNFSAIYGSIGLGTTTSTADVYINDGLILEFDLIERNGNGNVQWKRGIDSGFDAMPSYIGHHKHTIYKDKQLFTVDDEVKYGGWVNRNLGDYIRISIYGANSEVSVKFANFKLYPI